MAEQIFKNLDLNGNEVNQTSKVEILQDASSPNDATRKSQTETIASNAAQGILVTSGASSSNSTAYTSQTINGFLAGKQPNMSIHSSSSAFAEIVGGNQIKITRLTTNEVAVDTVSTTLSQAVGSTCTYSSGWTCVGKPLQEGDVLIIENATDSQQRSWILNGNANGDLTDFTRLQTDYDDAVIKAMFGNGAFLDYDTLSGVFSVRTGTGNQDLGAQTLPMDSTKWQVLAADNTNVELSLLALESLIQSVDQNASSGSTTLSTRIDNLAGVSGAQMGEFNGVLPDNVSIKAVLQSSESLHAGSSLDRAAIRAEANAQANTEAAALASEAAIRTSNDSTLQSNINTLSATQVADKAELVNTINTNNVNRVAADNALDARLDTVEGDDTVVGSVANAKKVAQDNAQAYTNQQVTAEANARTAAVNALDLKVDNLAEGDVQFVGQILANGEISIRQARIDANDNRNAADFNNVALSAGEEFIFAANTSVTYTDGTVVTYEQGDKLMVVDDVTAGTIVESQVNVVPNNVTGLAIANVGSSTIGLDGSNQLAVIDDSVGRNQLNSSVESDIDDKRSLTQSNAITSSSDTHFVTDTGVGADQNIHFRRSSNTTDALNGTKRTILGELLLSTSGSGDPSAPAFAHTATFATHYDGNCSDLSLAIGGINAEASANSSSAVYATGVYALARATQNGINAGITGVGQGAGISNIGVTGFSQTGGAGKDRGGVFSVADVDFTTYAALRSLNPISEPDVALIADAGYAPTSKAFYAKGQSILDGDVTVTGDVDMSTGYINGQGVQVVPSITVPSATQDANPVNLGDIKAREAIYEFDLTDSVVKSVPSVLDLDKVLWRVVDDNTSVTVDVQLDADVGQFLVTATGGSLSNVRLLVQELSCSVTSV